MKNYVLLSATFLLSLTTFAQEQPSGQKRELKPVQAEATGARKVEVGEKDSLAGETIEHLDAMILAIDHKVEYVNSDQAMRERAQADGWFEKMAAHRARAVARREALLARKASE